MSSAQIKTKTSEIYYCIRKHQAEDFFSVTYVFVCGDIVETWITEDFTSMKDAAYDVDFITAKAKQEEFIRKLFAELLEKDPNVLQVTRGLTILYLNTENKLCVSKRTGNIFEMPGFIISKEIADLFKTAGGELRV